MDHSYVKFQMAELIKLFIAFNQATAKSISKMLENTLRLNGTSVLANVLSEDILVFVDRFSSEAAS